jgi:hypothetical protein
VPIVAETDGGVTKLDGSARYLDARKILASNRRLRRPMRETIAKACPEGGAARSLEPRRPVTRPSLSATSH